MRIETTDNPLYDLHIFLEEMNDRTDAQDFSFQADRGVRGQMSDILEALDEQLTGEVQRPEVYDGFSEQIIGGQSIILPLAIDGASVQVDDSGAVTIDRANSPEEVIDVWDELAEEVVFGEFVPDVEDAREEDYERYDNPQGNVILGLPNRWSVSLLSRHDHIEAYTLDPEGNAWARSEIINLFPEVLPEFLAAVRDTQEKVWTPGFFNHLQSLAN